MNACHTIFVALALLIFSFVQPLYAQTEGGSSSQSGRPDGIPLSFESEWLADSDSSLANVGGSVKVPLLWLRRDGEPPPMINIGFNYTDLKIAAEPDLPQDLYEATVGFSALRRVNQRWAVRVIAGVDFATDGENRSSDAWRFRGGAFAVYDASDEWKWSFGAIALGRRDLPVVPAIGAIWQPNQRLRCDLILPKPRVNYLLNDDGQRQNWAYGGVGLDGNTWGYQRADGSDDQLSYGDWRVVAGWESRPFAPIGVPFVVGRKYSAEIGYAFSRDIEFDDASSNRSLPGSFLLNVSTRY